MLCSYGCEQEANHVLKNGKNCCQPSFNSCSAIKKKNSDGLKKAHEDGKIPGFDNIQRQRSIDTKVNEAISIQFQNNSPANNPWVKRILIEKFDWKEECVSCGLGTEWNNKSIVLHLDHIDGNNRNNNFSNLRFLCPNCHSQTETYCGKGSDGKIKVSDDEMIVAIKRNKNIRQVLIDVGLTAKGKNYERVRSIIEKNNLTF